MINVPSCIRQGRPQGTEIKILGPLLIPVALAALPVTMLSLATSFAEYVSASGSGCGIQHYQGKFSVPASPDKLESL